MTSPAARAVAELKPLTSTYMTPPDPPHPPPIPLRTDQGPATWTDCDMWGHRGTPCTDCGEENE